MINQNSIQDLINELNEFVDVEIIDSLSERKRFSRDFFDYSPILSQRLASCCADLVVRPKTFQAISRIAFTCKKYSIPLTLRGSGSGNYGQCVPLKGGVVMLMGGFQKIRGFDSSTGIVEVESGCLLSQLQKYLLGFGRELRLMPSTWRTATIGGFIAGGSGGIGSVRWGFLRDPGNLLGLEIVSVTNEPEIIHLDASEAEAINHAYGTNGIITALTLATAPAVDWNEVAIDCENWSDAVELIQTFVFSSIQLHLCCLLEKEIINQLPDWCSPSPKHHRIILLVAPDGITTIERLSIKAGAIFNLLGPEDNSAGKTLRELSWNHTTLHMRLTDSKLTYLQMLLPQPELPAMNSLKKKWGDDLLWHLEVVRQAGCQRLAALPIVRWKGEKLLEELINDCKQIGCFIFNPHVITVEDGGLGVIDSDQVNAKNIYDPSGILNPGKLRGWSKT